MPVPAIAGEDARAWRMLRHLAGRYRVHLGCVGNPESDRRSEGLVRQFCQSMHVAKPVEAPRRPGLLTSLLGGGADSRLNPGLLAWVQRVWNEQRPARALALGGDAAPFALLRPDLQAVRILDRADLCRGAAALRWAEPPAGLSALRRWFRDREARGLVTQGRGDADGAVQLFPDPAAVDRFKGLLPTDAERFRHLPDGVDVEHFTPSRSYPDPGGLGAPTLVLAGSGGGSAQPDFEAILWFTALVFPVVRAGVPELRLVISGGAGMAALDMIRGLQGVVLAPSDPDPRPWLAHSSAVVLPQRAAAREAALQAMSMARPVVGTAAALADLGEASGRELWRADTAEEFARAVLAAMNPQIGNAAGRAARARAVADHSWERVLARLDRLLEGEPVATSLAGWPLPTRLRP